MPKKSEFYRLKNVGKATVYDLQLLGITSIEQLSQQDPSELYLLLEAITNTHQDPCVWDNLAAIIHEAKTGEKLPWWHWTPIRKQTYLNKALCSHKTSKKSR